MTRKDYILLADAMKRSTPIASDGEVAMRNWIWTCANLAQTLSQDNPRFDRSRFIAACEGS